MNQNFRHFRELSQVLTTNASIPILFCDKKYCKVVIELLEVSRVVRPIKGLEIGDRQTHTNIKKWVSLRVLDKKHKLILYEGVKYLCNRWDYHSTVKQNLVLHHRSVHEGIKYRCILCSYKAKQKGHLKKR